MAKNRKTPDMNLPVWFDGQKRTSGTGKMAFLLSPLAHLI